MRKNSKMKMKHLPGLTGLAQATLAAAALLAFGTPSVAQAGPSPLQLTVSLDSPATVTQGEPIVLHYHVANTQEVPRTCLDRPQGRDWLAESLTDAAGRAVPPAAQFDPQRFAGGFEITLPTFPVPALGAYDGYAVINQGFAAPAPGRYTLTVRASLLSDLSAEVRVLSGSDDPDTLTQTFSFPLVVTSADNGRLAAVAKSLTDVILQKPDAQPDFETRSMRIRSLFSMPGAVAAPFWARVAQSVDVSDELYRAHTAAAADVLASVGTDGSAPQKKTEPYRRWLDRMYETGDAGLRQHVGSLYDHYGLHQDGIRIEAVRTN